ncbi:uncharacterized protein LOC135164699 isoform X4 [Diachasmimorpha longicaudata]|uniref:uncharacterized protein LOC135164699 isoform X4 n=1 Tax=Diachasmimorpha longicaudata TaxID=58733 RepID=UPI0030B8F28C
MNGRDRLITFSDSDVAALPLLIDDDEDINSSFQHYHPTLKPVIMRGVAMHLAEWPSHLFSIFTTVCIVSAAFIALTFVTIILFAADRKPRCRYEIVYLVNLQRHVPEASSPPVNTSLMLNFDATEDAVSALTERYTNVRSIDIVASTFFSKSILGDVYTKFDGTLLEIAVKSQLLWTYAGIALEPLQIDGIKYLKDYLCRSNELCKPMKNAVISADGSLLVSPVPCHTFFEAILKKLARESQDTKKTVRDAYNSFCARREKCIGVEILNNISWNISHRFTCPVIFPERAHRS